MCSALDNLSPDQSHNLHRDTVSSQVLKIPFDKREKLIKEIFSGRFTVKELADRWDCSRSHILAVKRGKTYAHLLPKIKRPSVREEAHRRCTWCLHYSGDESAPCGLGFPDANNKAWRTDRLHEYRDGRVKAAVDCSAYIQSNNLLKEFHEQSR